MHGVAKIVRDTDLERIAIIIGKDIDKMLHYVADLTNFLYIRQIITNNTGTIY